MRHEDRRTGERGQFAALGKAFISQLVSCGSGKREIHAQTRRVKHQRRRHVVAVADEGEFQTPYDAEVFAKGLHVGESLAGMVEVAQGIHDGHVRPARQIVHRLLKEGARHDAAEPAIEIARHIFERFAQADPAVVNKREAAQFLNGELESHSRSQRRLLKEHRDRFPRESGAVFTGRAFDVVRKVEDGKEFTRSEVEIPGQIAGGDSRNDRNCRHEFLCTLLNI